MADSQASEYIETPEEKFWKHVPKGHIDQGKIGKSAFIPRRQDEGKLSLDSSSINLDPKRANEIYCSRNGNPIFTGSIYLRDFHAVRLKFGETSNLRLSKSPDDYFVCEKDPLPANGEMLANDAHCLVHYHDIVEMKAFKKRLGQLLADRANENGVEYPEIDSSGLAVLVKLPNSNSSITI